MQRIYFDHNATTPLRPSAMDAMHVAMANCVGNPSSTHTSGRQARQYIDEARDKVAHLLGVPAREILFTSGGTEADNLAIFSMDAIISESQKSSVGLTNELEHSAVRDTAKELEKMGRTIHYISSNQNGEFTTDQFESYLADHNEINWASIHWANNETGVLQPVEKMSRIAKEYGLLFHSDAVQALGRLDIDMNNFAGDFLSLSSHKIGGPKGVGALWVRDAKALPQRQFGGKQERESRPGTENLYGIVGFGAAAEATFIFQKEERTEVMFLRDAFEQALLNELPELKIHAQHSLRLPNTSSILFPKKTADLMLMALDIRGFDLSAGSACSSGSVQYSPIIKAMGFSEKEAASTLRISFGRGNTQQQVDQLVKALVEVYQL